MTIVDDQMSRPIEAIDVSDPGLYEADLWRPVFARLRNEAPIHYCADSAFGPFWSVTRFEDIMAVDSNHEAFSSVGGVSIGDRKPDFEAPNFISMDPPKHDAQRMSVTPAVAPMQLQKMEPLIRQRVQQLLMICQKEPRSTGWTKYPLSSPLRCSQPCLISRLKSVGV